MPPGARSAYIAHLPEPRIASATADESWPSCRSAREGLVVVQDLVHGMPGGAASRPRPAPLGPRGPGRIGVPRRGRLRPSARSPSEGVTPHRRDHALAGLAALDATGLPGGEGARGPGPKRTYPPPRPSHLLHGDLLGQNLLLDLEDHDPWCRRLVRGHSLGDAAYDLRHRHSRVSVSPSSSPAGSQKAPGSLTTPSPRSR